MGNRKNVTGKCDILHEIQNALMFNQGDLNDFISLIDWDGLSYIPLKIFAHVYEMESVLTGSNGYFLNRKSWNVVTSIIDKFHKHTCGHSTISDIRLVLQRNELWNAAVDQYVNEIVSNCT